MVTPSELVLISRGFIFAPAQPIYLPIRGVDQKSKNDQFSEQRLPKNLKNYDFSAKNVDYSWFWSIFVEKSVLTEHQKLRKLKFQDEKIKAEKNLTG